MNQCPTGRRYGPDAWLLKFGTRADLPTFRRGEALRQALEARPPRGLAELVPAFATLLCRFDRGMAPGNDGWWAAWGDPPAALAAAPAREVEIPVRYDGEDLGAVARLHGMTESELARRHAAGKYFVHCLGFAPGFPYLGGLDPTLHTPRRPVPRPRVTAGSVGIGGEHTGIYSIGSPGGWNLIGTTPLRLFDPGATGAAAFLLRAGDAVRFVESSQQPEPLPVSVADRADAPVCLAVISAGMGLTVQDFGRPGWARFGVPGGGAMDPVSLERANRLVDNPPGTPALELALGRQELRAATELVVGLAGADLGAVLLRAGGDTREALESGRTISLHAGDRLRFPGGRHGVWAYLAVPGGVAGATAMGSRSTTPRAGIGTVLGAGGEVRGGGNEVFRLPHGTAARRLPWDGEKHGAGEITVRVWPGPQADAFEAPAIRRWFGTPWRVSAQSDRVGYRLEGESLASPAGELLSEPVLPGSVQVPPGGQPIVTMADGPTMGGYAKLALVDPDDLPRMAQAAPGTHVRFVAVEGSGWPRTGTRAAR